MLGGVARPWIPAFAGMTELCVARGWVSRLRGRTVVVGHGGVTLTPALSRRGRGGRRAAGDGFPFARERRCGMGSHPHPPYRERGRLFDRLRAGSALSRQGPSRERGTACRRGWVPVCTGTTVGMGSHPHPFEGEGDGVPPGMGSRLHGNDGWHGESPSPHPLRGRGGRRGAGDGFPFARERRLAWGSHPHLRPLPSRERGTACRRGWVPVCTGTTGVCGESPSPQPSPVEGEGDGVPPGMGSRLHGNDGWHGESPSPPPSAVEGEGDGVPPGMGSRLHGNDGCAWGESQPHPNPLPSRERGTACRRGWVPVCTGTTGVWGESSLTPTLSRRGRGGRRGAGDGFPFARERRLAWGVTLTPALSRRGRGGRRGAGDGFPSARERRLAWGVQPHPNPLPSRERGRACRRGWVPVCTGTTVGMGSHPHPPYRVRGRLFDRLRAGSALSRRGPVEGEGDGVPPGMGSRLHGNDGWHGESPSPPALSRQGRGGTACRRGWVPVSAGTTGVCGESPSPPVSSTGQASPQAPPSPVEGEGEGVPPGMGSRLQGNDGLGRRGRARDTRCRRLDMGQTHVDISIHGSFGSVVVSAPDTAATFTKAPRSVFDEAGLVEVRGGGGDRGRPDDTARVGIGGRGIAGVRRPVFAGTTATLEPTPPIEWPSMPAPPPGPSSSRERMWESPSPQPSPRQWRGGPPVCTGTTGVCGESPSPQPSPVKGEGDGVPPGMGSRPLRGNDGCVWGVTLTPSRERGTACRRGWVPVCTGTTGVCGESPSPQPSPGKGEGDGVAPGMGSRLHGNDGWDSGPVSSTGQAFRRNDGRRGGRGRMVYLRFVGLGAGWCDGFRRRV